MRPTLAVLGALMSLAAAPALAQTARVTGPCGTQSLTVGRDQPATMDATGALCVTDAVITPHALDIASVTTGGTAVNAIAAGHAIKGGFLRNPATATTSLCISITGAAATSEAADVAGGTACVPPGYSYTVPPIAGAVSVNASDSAHPFSGAVFY